MNYEELKNDKMYWYVATCVKVVDGDTVDLDISVGFNIHIKERVRIYGIDTPEVYGVKKESEEYKNGMLASNRTKELVEGKEVLVNTIKDKTGKYGRYLAYILVDSGSGSVVYVGDVLVAEGLAERKEY